MRVPDKAPTCCDNRPLKVDTATEARLYTLTRGVLPIFVRTYYCRSQFHPCIPLQ